MLVVPAFLSQVFKAQLKERNIPDQQHRDFHKWLRYYLDFCSKYYSDPKLTASFAPFDEKLQSKGQSETQRQQARLAVAMYYRILGAINATPSPTVDSSPKNPVSSTQSVAPKPVSSSHTGLPSTKPEVPQSAVAHEPPKIAGANWVTVYEQLHTAIRVRHYSNKTWQA